MSRQRKKSILAVVILTIVVVGVGAVNYLSNQPTSQIWIKSTTGPSVFDIAFSSNWDNEIFAGETSYCIYHVSKQGGELENIRFVIVCAMSGYTLVGNETSFMSAVSRDNQDTWATAVPIILLNNSKIYYAIDLWDCFPVLDAIDIRCGITWINATCDETVPLEVTSFLTFVGADPTS